MGKWGKKKILIGALIIVIFIVVGISALIFYGSFKINELSKMTYKEMIDYTTKDNKDAVITFGIVQALTGGYLPEISSKYFSSIGMYDLSLIVRIILIFIILIIAMVYIKETVVNENKKQVSLLEHIKNSSNIVIENKNIICIFISVFSTGFLFSSLETYWQPHFISLMPNNGAMFLLGVMAFIYFAAAMAGNIIYGPVFSKFNTKKMYMLLRSILAMVLIITASQTNMVLFMVFYSLIYLFFGMSNIPESIILNREIPNEFRASVLSLNSLILQIGVLFGSFINSIIINYSTIPGLWFMASAVIMTIILIIYKKLMSVEINKEAIW